MGKVISSLTAYSQISLQPLYGENKESETLLIPIVPSTLMFDESSSAQTINLMNYGELPVGMNRKLATWGFTCFFPYYAELGRYDNKSKNGYMDKNNEFKYPFDISNRNEDPYEYYCNKILTWKNKQTPLTFIFKTWGSYYLCQIKDFKYGRQDSSGNVYYDIQFQEYKEYTKFQSSAYSTNYSGNTYIAQEGDTLLIIAKKIYDDSSAYTKIMELNNMNNTEIVVGQSYKIR